MIERADDIVLVVTTTDDRAVAEAIAKAVIEKRLAACASISMSESRYRWRSEVVSAAEFVVTIKTTAEAADAVAAEIKARHGYELPEILVFPALGGSTDYLAWLRGEVAPTLEA